MGNVEDRRDGVRKQGIYGAAAAAAILKGKFGVRISSMHADGSWLEPAGFTSPADRGSA